MDYFNYNDNAQLFAEELSVQSLAEQYGTPLYVYSRATIERHWQAFDQALGSHPHLICYAVKANSNLAVLNIMARLGSGFDIVSKGELARVIQAGGDPKKVVFSGVGKKEDEIEYALKHQIHCFNVESFAELDRIQKVAKNLDQKAPISLRINPDVDAGTHPYISTGLKENKFGIAAEQAIEVYEYANQLSHLDIIGIDCHIGSQLTDIKPFCDALDRLLSIVEKLAEKGIQLKHLDLGGGLGVHYQDEHPPLPADYAKAIQKKLSGHSELQLILEPGRAIMANAGILVTQVEFLKQNEEKNFCIVDAAMNDLMRPCLYSAWQRIEPVDASRDRESKIYDIVGPICETSDFLGKDRALAVAADDYLVVRASGAYGFTMSSNYNSRPRAAELMVDGSQHHVIRERETLDDLWRGEQLLPNDKQALES